MYSRYASSSTTRQSGGTASRNSSSSARRTTVPVGLFGLQTKMILVRSVIASAIAARSCVSSRSGTRTDSAPDRSASVGYASNDRQAYSTCPPGSAAAARSCWVTPTEPQPTAMCACGTPNRALIAAIRACAPLSGYRWASPAAAAITSSTDGSGPNGDSLDASLNDRPSGDDVTRPGL